MGSAASRPNGDARQQDTVSRTEPRCKSRQAGGEEELEIGFFTPRVLAGHTIRPVCNEATWLKCRSADRNQPEDWPAMRTVLQ
jgi:hypothetical protein